MIILAETLPAWTEKDRDNAKLKDPQNSIEWQQAKKALQQQT